MPNFLDVAAGVVTVPKDGYGTETALNVGPGSLYYKAGSTVSSGSNDGTLTSGSSLSLTGPTSFVAVSQGARLVVSDPQFDEAASVAASVGQPGGVAAFNDAVQASTAREYEAPAFGVINPAITPVLSGTFVPRSTSVLFEAFSAFKMLEPAGGHCGIYLLWGPSTATSPLTPVTLSNWTGSFPNGQGVNKVLLGAVGGEASGGAMAKVLSGLTPGATYKFEVAVVVVGYAASITLPGQPYSMAVAKTASPYPESAIYWAAPQSTGVTIGKADHSAYRYRDDIKATVPLVVGDNFVAGRCRLTPDGSKAVVTAQFGTKVAVVTTGSQDGSAPALQGSYSLPAGDTSSYGLAINAAGTTAYVCCVGGTDSGKILPLNLATGVFGTAMDMGQGSGGLGWDAEMSADGAFVYAALHMTNKAVVIRQKVADGTSAGTIVLSSSTGAFAQSLALSPDGNTLWVAGATATGSATVWKIDLSAGGFALAGAPNSFAVSAGPIEGIRAFADGLGLIMGLSTTTGSSTQGTAANQVHQHFTGLASSGQTGPPFGQEYTTWINSLVTPNPPADSRAYDIGITPNGAMYLPDFQHNKVNIWFGGQAWNPFGTDFWASTLRARILGA